MIPSDLSIEGVQTPTPASGPLAPPAPVEDAGPTLKGGAKLPDEVASNDIVKKVMTGEIPGVLVRPGIYYPKASKIAESSEALLDAGMDFYKALDSSTVFFNPRSISEAQIQEADRNGQLVNLVPDYETLSGEKPAKPTPAIAKRLREQMGVAGEAPTSIIPAPAGGANTLPPASGGPSAAEEAELAGKRVANVSPGSPTSGPRPGAGRILNSLLKPAV